MFKLLMLLLAGLWFPGGGDDDPDLGIDEPDPDGSPDEPDPDDDTDDDPAGAGGDDSDLDPEALRAELARVRREAANRRTQLRERESEVQTQQEQINTILQALGITDDTDDDPSAEAERLRTENRRLRTQASFGSVARAAGADEDLAWGYLLARGEIDSLDPDADDFATTLRTRLDAALTEKPSLSVSAPTPPPGPSDFDQPNPDPEDPAGMEMKEYMEWRKKNLTQE